MAEKLTGRPVAKGRRKTAGARSLVRGVARKPAASRHGAEDNLSTVERAPAFPSRPAREPEGLGLPYIPTLVLAFARAFAAEAAAVGELGGAGSERLCVYLDCQGYPEQLIRAEVDFVEYVTEPDRADVGVRVARAGGRRGFREFVVEFAGRGRLEGFLATTRVGYHDKAAADLPLLRAIASKSN
jgi:hypothetical protein